jgi:hypothetical protein
MKRNDYQTAAAYYDQFVDEYHGRKSSCWLRALLAAIEARARGYLDALLKSGSS